MQEKKFRVQPVKDMENFKSDLDYWVYSVVEDNDSIRFLMYSEKSKSWEFYESVMFIPAKEKSAEELLSDFQSLMNKN